MHCIAKGTAVNMHFPRALQHSLIVKRLCFHYTFQMDIVAYNLFHICPLKGSRNKKRNFMREIM